LQYNSELSSTNWANLGNPITATGATLTVTNLRATDLRSFEGLRWVLLGGDFGLIS
jgi:hypothetical protein